MRHVYMFYQRIGTFDPMFIGWTDNKKIAMKFNTMRKGFYMIDKDATDEDIALLRNPPYEKNEIFEYKFKTEVGGLRRVLPMMVTLREIYDISIHKENICIGELSKVTIVPPHIFKKDVEELLNRLGYLYAMIADEPLPFTGTFYPIEDFKTPPIVSPVSIGKYDSSIFTFPVDELSLFILMHKDTIRDIEKWRGNKDDK